MLNRFMRRRQKKLAEPIDLAGKIEALAEQSSKLADIIFSAGAGEPEPSQEAFDAASRQMFAQYEKDFRKLLAGHGVEDQVMQSLVSLGMSKARIAFEDRWRDLKNA